MPPGIKAVVVSPTKELAMQTGRVLKLLLPGLRLRASLLSKATAAGSDFSKVDILLANPLRLGAMADEGKLDLSQVRLPPLMWLGCWWYSRCYAPPSLLLCSCELSASFCCTRLRSTLPLGVSRAPAQVRPTCLHAGCCRLAAAGAVAHPGRSRQAL